VQSSCSACLAAEVQPELVPPGGRAVVRARLNLLQLEGPVVRLISLDSNDPSTPSATLELAGVVVQSYDIQPQESVLNLAEGQREVAVEISSRWKLRAPLTQAVCSNSNLDVQIKPETVSACSLRLRARDTFPGGDTSCEVVLHTANPQDPTCRVVCVVHNPPDLDLVPAQLRLRAEEAPQTRILWIRQHGTNSMILLDVLPPANTIDCEIVPATDEYCYRVDFTAWKQSGFSGRTNWLTLKLQDRNLKEKLVPVPVVVD
jgi:hypothetical protein